MFREELRIHKIAKPATMKTKFKFLWKYSLVSTLKLSLTDQSW